MKALLIIGLGGAFGSICRYLAQVSVAKYISLNFPLGTFLVNISGCFLIGIFFGLSNKQAWMTLEWRLLLMTGICGGFTTFSSFSLDSFNLFRQGNYTYFALYVLGSVILGLLATVGGAALIR